MGKGFLRAFSRRAAPWAALLALLLLACRVQVNGPMPVAHTGPGSGPAAPAGPGADTTPPTVVQVSSPAEVYFGASCGAPTLPVQVRVQDDAGPPAQVWLEYAYAGQSQGRRLPLGSTGGDGYAGQIPVGQEAPQALPQGGALYYRVWAADAAGNRATAPGPSQWFQVGVIPCGGSADAGAAPASPGGGSNPPPAAPPPGAPPGGGSAPPGGSSPNNPGGPNNPPPAAPPGAPPGGGSAPPGGSSPDNPGGQDDPPVICYPNCDDGGDDIVELPPEYQPEYPPGDIVFNPDEIGDMGNDPGGAPAQPPAQPGTLVVVNQSSFPVVSLKFMYDDPQTGQRVQEDVILAMNQVIPSGGGTLTVSDLVPGVVYSVMPGIGFWDAGGRTITGYLAPQVVQVQPGETATLTIGDPSVQELVTQFGTVTRYKGLVMGGSPVASYCAYLDLNGNGYTFTLVHESGQTVLSDSGTFYDTHISTGLGYIALQFNGNATSFEGSYYFKGPEIGTLKLLNVQVPGQGVFPYLELLGSSSLCP